MAHPNEPLPLAPHPPPAPAPVATGAPVRPTARRGHSRHTSAFHSVASPRASPVASPTSLPSVSLAPLPVGAASASPSAASSSAVPARLPYHHKRLLELVDPSTYDAVLTDTARQIGVNLRREPQKRWVIESMFLAPLPEGSVRCYDEQGRAYYWNTHTNSSSWVHPCAKQFEALLKAQESPASQMAHSQPSSHFQPPPAAPRPSDRDDDSDASSTAGSSVEAAIHIAPAGAPKHTRAFIRSNAGLASTSSLRLTEAELAMWGAGKEEADEQERQRLNAQRNNRHSRPQHARRQRQQYQHHPHHPRSDESGSEIDDELGGRDGQRWRGEDAEDDEQAAMEEEAEMAEMERQRDEEEMRRTFDRPGAESSMQRPRAHNGAASRTYMRPSSSTASGRPAPWSTRQPPPFHRWVSAGGVGDTEVIVPNQGSLIAASATTGSTRPPRPATAHSSARPRAQTSRPRSAVWNAALAHTSSEAAREAASQHIRDSHRHTRAAINGSLRSQASSLYSLRQLLSTKSRGLTRWLQGLCAADERDWRHMYRSSLSLARATETRVGLFRLALPMLDEADARALGRMLARTGAESQAALAREQMALDEAHSMRQQGQQLQQEIAQQIEQITESLRVDAQCIELARSGGLSEDASLQLQQQQQQQQLAGGVGVTSLPVVHELLARVEAFQAHARAWHSASGAKRHSEKALLSELSKANSLLLRRGFQHASERKAAVHSEVLAHHSLLPALQSKLKSLAHNLSSQMGPLAVCQRTYELRKRDASHEHGDLLRRLEDELAALTTLVAHLESEHALTTHQLAEWQEQERMRQAEISAEEVRSKFYKSMMAVHGAGNSSGSSHTSAPPPSASSAPAPRSHANSSSMPPHPPHQGHSLPAPPPPPAPSHSPRDDSELYRSDPARVGTYLHSFNADAADTPGGEGRGAHGQWMQWAHNEGGHQQQQLQHHQSPPRPSSSHAHSGALGGSDSPLARARSLPVRPASSSASSSAAGTSGPPAPLSTSDALRLRSQLVRDQASNIERLRTRKVRRAKVANGAANKSEMLIPSAGRPVFEGGHSRGYDS